MAAKAWGRLDKRRSHWRGVTSSRVEDPVLGVRYSPAGHLPVKWISRLLGKSLREPLNPGLDRLYREKAQGSPLSRVLSTLQRGWLVDNLLTLADRTSMAHGVEMRVPFIYGPLATLAAGLPDDDRVKGQMTKVLLRRWVEKAGGDQPGVKALLERPKRAFPVPLRQWFKGELGRRVEERVLAGPASDFLETRVVKKLFRRHRRGRENHDTLLFAMGALDAALRP